MVRVAEKEGASGGRGVDTYILRGPGATSYIYKVFLAGTAGKMESRWRGVG